MAKNSKRNILGVHPKGAVTQTDIEDAIRWFRFTPKEIILEAIGLSHMTMNLVTETQALSSQHSNALLALMEVTILAERTLGSQEAAERWLNAEAIGLDGVTPISRLSTVRGAQAVTDLLTRIERGVYA